MISSHLLSHDVVLFRSSEDAAEQLAWLLNFLDRTGSLRAQLMAVKGLEAPDFAKQLMRAAAVAFGGGLLADRGYERRRLDIESLYIVLLYL